MNLPAELRSAWMWIFTDKKQSWFSEREVLSRLWSQSRAGERTGAFATRLPDTQEKPQVHMMSSFYSGVEYRGSCISCCFLLFQSQKKVRSADIWSAKRLQENENRFVTGFSLIVSFVVVWALYAYTKLGFWGLVEHFRSNTVTAEFQLCTYTRATNSLRNGPLFCLNCKTCICGEG